jgi:RNA polymerase sigma-B factor
MASATGGHEIVGATAGEVRVKSLRYPYCAPPGELKDDNAIRSGMELTAFQERFNRLQQHPLLQADPRQGITVLSRTLGVTPTEWHRLEVQRLLARPANLDDPSLAESVSAHASVEPCGLESAGPSVASLLALLEPRQQLVVRQVVLAGWSYRRLGRQMEVSPMTVKRLLHKGLEQLRQHLEAGGFSPGGRPDRAASAVPGC